MPQFNGQLRSSELFAGLYNMIIGQQVFGDNIADSQSELVNMSRQDGGLYGDQKLYYSTDILTSKEWVMDSAESTNLLALHRPQTPQCQAIIVSKFRQIALTLDEYLSKRGWSNITAFSQFMSILEGWIGETKRVYEAKMFNTYVGTQSSSNGKQSVDITLPVNEDQEKENRLQAQTIAQKIADIYVSLANGNREYNDYGNYRSFSKNDMIVVWNSSFKNKILYTDLPTIYHKDGLFDAFKYSLPSEMFGTINNEAGTTSASNVSIRSLIEKDYNTVEPSNVNYNKALHIFPGDLLPPNTQYGAGETYTEDNTIICKMYHKRSIPFLSAFEVGTNFFNPKNLSTNRYLTWGYSQLEYLKNYPFITIKGIEAEA